MRDEASALFSGIMRGALYGAAIGVGVAALWGVGLAVAAGAFTVGGIGMWGAAMMVGAWHGLVSIGIPAALIGAVAGGAYEGADNCIDAVQVKQQKRSVEKLLSEPIDEPEKQVAKSKAKNHGIPRGDMKLPKVDGIKFEGDGQELFKQGTRNDFTKNYLDEKTRNAGKNASRSGVT